MKWPADQTLIMTSAFRQFFNNSQFDITQVKDRYKDDIWSAIWAVYAQVTYDLQHSDSHPAFQPGCWDNGEPREPRTRRVQHDPLFVLYPKGCNDSHLKTMLKHVAMQIGLL